MTEELRNAIKNEERYSDFTLFDEPVVFSEWQKNVDIPCVQLHSTQLCGPKDSRFIVGFCGVFAWKDNEITPLDGDVYSENTTVVGFNWFHDEENGICLDILVDEW